MPIRRAAPCAAFILLAVAPLRAQPSPNGELTEHSIWFVYTGDHPVSKRAGFVFDAQLRLTEDGDHLRQLLVRPGVSFAPSPNLKLSAGYVLMGARDDGNDPLLPRRPEHRLWAGALLGHDVGPIALSHRAKLEHRWLSGVRVDGAGNPAGEVWVHAERARYQLRASLPLSHGGSRHDLYVTGSDEVFASFGGYAGSLAVDQNRASVGLGVRAAAAVRIEVGYMLQSSAGDDGRFTEQNHTLQLTVLSSARIR